MRTPKPVASYEAPLPTRATSPLPRHDDRGRRRFLKQLLAGAGAVSVGALPRLSPGQSLVVDFDKLASHPPLPTAEPEGALLDALVGDPAPSQSFAAAMQAVAAEAEPGLAIDSDDSDSDSDSDSDAEAPAEGMGLAAASEDEAELSDESDRQDQHGVGDLAQGRGAVAERGSDSGVELTENRAMWLASGYLVLLRWRRREDDNAVVAALEGANADVSAYLAERVTSVDNLHNIDQLHRLEADLLTLLQARVAPAVIEVLHLDHDCTAVCSHLDPSRMYPPDIQIDGELPAAGWE